MREIDRESRFRPPTPAEEEQFHTDIEPWLDSMILRHNIGGRLTKLPYDPERHQSQKLAYGTIRARLPSKQELDSLGKDTVLPLALEKIKSTGYEAVGEEPFNAIVDSMLTHNGGLTVRKILDSLSTPDSNVAILLAHANLQDIPFMEIVTLAALARASQQTGAKFELDVFDIMDQSYTYASETMTRLAWDGVPVMDILSGSANVIKVFPPTERGVRLPINADVKSFINGRSRIVMDEEKSRLNGLGRSRLDYIAPAGTSMDRIEHDGKLVALRSKRINQVMAQTIVKETHLAWPIAIWLGENMSLLWEMLETSAPDSRDAFNATMKKLYRTTANLVNVDLLEQASSIGAVGVEGSR